MSQLKHQLAFSILPSAALLVLASRAAGAGIVASHLLGALEDLGLGLFDLAAGKALARDLGHCHALDLLLGSVGLCFHNRLLFLRGKLPIFSLVFEGKRG